MTGELSLDVGRVAESDRVGRPAYVAGLVVAVAGLILGTAYAGPFGPVALLASALLGGVLYRETDSVHGQEGYENAIAGAIGGAILSSATVSAVVSVSLGLPVLEVTVSTAPHILTAAGTVATLALVGFVGGLVVSLVGLRIGESLAGGLVVVGGAAFALVAVQLAGDEAGVLALSERVVAGAGLVAGAGVLVGVLSLLRSRDRRRRRLALAAVVLAGVVTGGLGVGSVGAEIHTARTGSAVADQLVVEPTAVNATDEALEVTLRIENPSTHGVDVAGVYLRVGNESAGRIGYGPARHLAGPTTVGAGETVTTTYRLPLSSAQVRTLRDAFERGDVVVSGRASLRLATTDPLLFGQGGGFDVQFRCPVEADGGDCLAPGES